MVTSSVRSESKCCIFSVTRRLEFSLNTRSFSHDYWIPNCNTPQCCKFTLTFSDHHLRTTSLSPNSLRNECKGLVTITDREGLLWGERKLVPLLSFPKEKALRINQLNNTVTTGPFFIACIYFLTFWILCYGLDNLITGNQQFTAMKL